MRWYTGEHRATYSQAGILATRLSLRVSVEAVVRSKVQAHNWLRMVFMSFFIGYVHGELVHARFMESVIREGRLMDAIIEGQDSEPFVDQARNLIVEKFLATKRDWFLSVDTDVILPERVITRLLARNQKLIGALIYVNAKPVFPQVYQKIADFGFHGFGTFLVDESWTPGELIKADATGAGCMLIHREVFEAIPVSKPFRWFQHEQRGEDLFGEDVVFCERAKRAGYQLYIDTAVKAGHIKPHVI